MNLPNKLTMLRVIMIPVFVALFLLQSEIPGGKWIAAAIFVLASLTDMLDGQIARRKNLVTTFGKFADPLADKLLVCSALICLVQFRMIPTWAVIVIVAREFIISGFRIVAAEKGVVLAASKVAKVKTVFQMVTVIFLILDLSIPAAPDVMPMVGTVLVYITVALTIVSLVEYLVKNWSVMEGDL